METSYQDETMINCIMQMIKETQSDICLYKKWHTSCQNKAVKASFHELVTFAENRLQVLYKEINEILSA